MTPTIDVMEYQGLVVSIARRYCRNGQELLDFIQEGNIGLLKARDKYDPDRPAKFSTVAHHWITKYVRMAAMKRGLIHVPFRVQYTARRVNRECAKTYARTGMDLRQTNFYADTSTSTADGVECEELPVECCADGVLENREERALINQAFELLSDKERDVLLFRMEGEELQAIGSMLGCSKQRVNQIFNKAVCKIQSFVQLNS